MPSVPWIPKFAKQLLDIKALLSGNKGKALVINQDEDGITVSESTGNVDGGSAGIINLAESYIISGGSSPDTNRALLSGGSSTSINSIIISGGAS